jgi:hypothetical protein
MSWARNRLALAALPQKDTPLPWPNRQDRQHLQSADDSFAGHAGRIAVLAAHCVERTDRRARVRRQSRLCRNQYLLNLDWKFDQHEMADVV